LESVGAHRYGKAGGPEKETCWRSASITDKCHRGSTARPTTHKADGPPILRETDGTGRKDNNAVQIGRLGRNTGALTATVWT